MEIRTPAFGNFDLENLNHVLKGDGHEILFTWVRSCDLTFCLTSIITGSHDKVIVIVYTIVVRIIVCSTFELWSVTFSLLTCVSFQEDDWYASAWWRPSRNESRKESWVRSPESGLTQERHLSSIILKPCLMYVGEYFYYALFWWDSQLSGANSLPQGILLMALTLLENLMSETDFWEINPCKFPEYQESVFFSKLGRDQDRFPENLSKKDTVTWDPISRLGKWLA